ncbi:GCN5-related N-acetyltransferase [[Leptolyngbya] sp. PCC 7376]|uniref:GNAT family N-acetyltransferase n=1 Tax=[Leptolyngbya] sp. PCC 7376 TaxID=111781 RepID=UPI00029F2869|nr:GNAT family N-acetyltransferase [[Leptolyngbya] sp. PCC 7376]AFY37920.1 GCN5-related N-acetyltransferase [[Leptolyngbya] sp. PCC 7376]
MTKQAKVSIRQVQYRDLSAIARLVQQEDIDIASPLEIGLEEHIENTKNHYGLVKLLDVFPNPSQYSFHGYVLEVNGELVAFVKISPFNSSQSTWRVDQIIIDSSFPKLEYHGSARQPGSTLLRYCFDHEIEARNWILEVNVNAKQALSLYRQNGFQPLAELTYWAIAPEILSELALQEPAIPNLMPVSNADARLLYQLDTASMPPMLRQVFDRHIQDFKTSPVGNLICRVQNWSQQTDMVEGYVFEPQRKAAIGYFAVQLAHRDDRPHHGRLTVHPAYTWLYPELFIKMSQIAQLRPEQPLYMTSTDYQPEREEFFGTVGATQMEHTLLMSRSVWHKVRETKRQEAWQLSGMLQGLQPIHTPIPSRMNWFKNHPSLNLPKSHGEQNFLSEN